MAGCGPKRLPHGRLPRLLPAWRRDRPPARDDGRGAGSLGAGARLARFRADTTGAVAVLFVILFPLLLLVGGFATDIALLNGQKRYVQAQADLAAQSAANHLPDPVAVRQVARQVVAANSRYGRITLTDTDIVLGSYSAAGGFVALANQSTAAGASAVRVSVPSRFRPLLLSPILSERDMTLRRSAVAARRAVVVFSLRNRLLGLDTRESILDGLLGPLGIGATVSLLSYEGLANLHLPLKDLLGLLSLDLAVDVLSFNDVLDLSLSLSSVLSRLENAGLLPRGATAGVPDQSFTLGEILTVSPGLLQLGMGDVLPDVSINVFDLVTALLGLAADPAERVEIGTGLDLAPLAAVKLKIGLIRPAVIAIGSPDDVPAPLARVAQVSVALEANVLAIGTTPLLHVALSLDVGAAEAVLDSLNCAASAPADRLATFLVETQPVDIALRVGVVDSRANVAPKDLQQTGVGGGIKTLHIRKDQFRVPVPVENPLTLSGLVSGVSSFLQSVQTDLQAQTNVSTCTLIILCQVGQILTSTLSALLAVLTPILDGVAKVLGSVGFIDGILQTLLDLLGISVAQADLVLEDYSCTTRLVR